MCNLNFKFFETVPHLKQINTVLCMSSLEISPLMLIEKEYKISRSGFFWVDWMFLCLCGYQVYRNNVTYLQT